MGQPVEAARETTRQEGMGTVTTDELHQLCRSLGHDPNDVAEIQLLPGVIKVRSYRKDLKGKHYLQTRANGERIPAEQWHQYGYEGGWLGKAR